MAAGTELEIAVTGTSWIGQGIGSIWSLVRESFSNAINEIQIAAYSLGENPNDLISLLDDVLVRGIRVTIIVNRFSEQHERVRNRLRSLMGKYQHLIIKDFSPSDRREDLHAKLIVIDHSVALVGSANLTWKGMVMNHELAVRLSGPAAYSIGELLDRISADTRPVNAGPGG